MKTYEIPSISITRFISDDILTTSTITNGTNAAYNLNAQNGSIAGNNNPFTTNTADVKNVLGLK